MSVTHIAAQDIVVEGRYLRQRCAWCGAVLLDYDLARVAVPIGQEGPPATWEAGRLVRVDGAFPEVYSLLDMDIDTGPVVDGGGDRMLPDDACALLDPEVTA